MITLVLEDRYTKYLSMFGDVQQIAEKAIYEYIRRGARERIARITLEQAEVEDRYGMDLDTVRQRVATDEEYLSWLNQEYPLWEEDLGHWIYASEEIKEWRQIEQTLSEH